MLTALTYVLPLKRTACVSGDELIAYLHELTSLVHTVVVVDGSPGPIFAHHHAVFPPAVQHIAVAPYDAATTNGKVAGVCTAMPLVRTPLAIIADDDIRYDEATLQAVAAGLRDADVVRPQCVFSPRAWHAYLDEGRSLLARVSGGDWPGTLGVRTRAFARAGGYSADVLFENLELVRTIVAAGGTERRLDGVYVWRRPPEICRYFEQRIRQAYDEFARPGRLAVQLAFAPLIAIAVAAGGPLLSAGLMLAVVAAAECGRRRSGGARMFPLVSSLLAPLWVLERAVTSWCAVCTALAGGPVYSGARLLRAAHSRRQLEQRFAKAGRGSG